MISERRPGLGQFQRSRAEYLLFWIVLWYSNPSLLDGSLSFFPMGLEKVSAEAEGLFAGEEDIALEMVSPSIWTDFFLETGELNVGVTSEDGPDGISNEAEPGEDPASCLIS